MVELGKQDVTKPPLYYGFNCSLRRSSMSHSLISFNQMAYTKHQHNSASFNEQDELMDDYFECLIDCEDDPSSCRRVCKEILMV